MKGIWSIFILFSVNFDLLAVHVTGAKGCGSDSLDRKAGLHASKLNGNHQESQMKQAAHLWLVP